MASSSEDRREEGAEQMVHKTKVIQFLGRTTPIVLQNDNGPCPLLAICNVLLLKNNMNLSPDIPEVSQEKLLSLVAERLLDSNSNTNNKDNEFAENQQQNISDAIDLLPRLTTGIDVNIKFRRIDDFEFTSECAIFDLLDIPLYHGWIVDPEDPDTANAIGSKSYNTIMGELVSLETNNVQSEYKQNPEDQCVDFAAATTATLGVPSPCLSRAKSFDDSPRSISNDHALRKGDLEEEADLIKALKLSESNDVNADNLYNDTDQSESLKKSVEKDMDNDVVPFEANSLTSKKDDGNSTGLSIPNIVKEPNADKAIETEVAYFDLSGSVTQKQNLVGDEHGQEQTKLPADFIESNDRGSNKALPDLIDLDDSKDNNSNNATPELTDHDEPENIKTNSATSDLTNLDKSEDNKSNDETLSDLADLNESKDKKSNDATPDLSNGKNVNVIEALTPVGGESEPLYEGEERIMESRTTPFVDGEPMYEGEVALAEQVEKNNKDGFDTCPKDEITLKQGELIRDFLSNSASQLTLYGLFRLQEGLKERELCVFFRNNHFSTMFKFDGELYLLATDQGYLSQSDLVWEKLNEVNGNTLFMTSNFKEFKVDESPTNNTTWDEQNAIADTTEYLASIDKSAKSQSNYTSDLELAIALQQQEYEQQQQVNNVDRPNVERPSVGRGSRLVTGPQRSSTTTTNQASSTPRQEGKQNKDKCIVM